MAAAEDEHGATVEVTRQELEMLHRDRWVGRGGGGEGGEGKLSHRAAWKGCVNGVEAWVVQLSGMVGKVGW